MKIWRLEGPLYHGQSNRVEKNPRGVWPEAYWIFYGGIFGGHFEGL